MGDHHGSHGGHGSHSHGGHGSHGSHSHAPASFGRAFAIGATLNIAFVVIEALFGFFGNSVALLADAGHNLSDVLGLLMAWGASALATRAPSTRYTYGMRHSSILAALFNAVLLLVAVGAITLEAVQRLMHPEPVAGLTVMVVAGIGILVNGGTALMFASGRKGDINIRGAYLHMAADAALSAGVVVSGLVILLTGWQWLDPLVSLAINVFIVWGIWGLLTDSLAMSLAAVPPGIDPVKVRRFLEQRAGVASIHDLHIWPMSTTDVALTCHLVMPSGHPGDAFLRETATVLTKDFSINHPTFQIETEADGCALAPENVV